MAKKISKKTIREITGKFNDVLAEHGIDHTIGNFSLRPHRRIPEAALICPIGQKPCIDPDTGNLVCVPIEQPCG